MSEFIDLTGKRFGMLVVQGMGNRTANGTIRWNCLCDCGRFHDVSTHHLKAGEILNCGCIKAQKTIARSTKHGDCRTRLYNIWIKMRDRCGNPKNMDWSLYGGRGISVCDEWQNSYESFKKWAENNGYSDELSIDRINSNKNYCPDNCRWTTAKVQANNTSRNHIVNYKGMCLTISEAAELAGLKYATVKNRITKYGWSVEKAIETPLRSFK